MFRRGLFRPLLLDVSRCLQADNGHHQQSQNSTPSASEAVGISSRSSSHAQLLVQNVPKHQELSRAKPVMDQDKLKEIIATIQAKRKAAFPWTFGEPFDQPYYSYSQETASWQETTPVPSPEASVSASARAPLASFTVLSWNIDFMLIHPNERMAAALEHLATLTSTLSTTTTPPPIVLLQEMLESDLAALQAAPWVRANYHLTDTSPRFWESGHYGTCTLVPRALPIARVFRVHYPGSRMERDALFVDVDVGAGQDRPLRLANTHLESLVADPPVRPGQMALAAAQMRSADVLGAVLGGDLNAIQPFDRALHADHGLGDAYLALGGAEDAEDGFTWGPMAPTMLRRLYGSSRMDKFFFGGAVRPVRFERFGLGVELRDERLKEELIEDAGTDGAWVTDHLGIRADFQIVSSDET